MTRKSRTVLFYFLVAIFLIFVPILIFYFQGYRFDFEKNKVVQTGGLFLKIWPARADLYLNQKFIKKTGFLSGEVLVENLLPKKYQIRVEKENYYPWQKTLEIEERKVTEAKNITLILKDPKFEKLSSGILDFFFLPNQKEVIFLKNGKNGHYLTLFDLEKKVESIIFEEKGAEEILDLRVNQNSKKILLNLAVKERSTFLIIDLQKSKNFWLDFDLLEGTEKILFHPQHPQKLFLIKSLFGKNQLEIFDLEKKELKPLEIPNFLTVEILGQNLLWLDQNGFLKVADLSLKNQKTLNIEPILPKKEKEYQILGSDWLYPLFLKEGETLYLLDPSSQKLVKFFEPVINLKFAEDQKKAVIFNRYEIYLSFFEEILGQPYRAPFEKIFLNRFSEKIGDLFWLSSNYLILLFLIRLRSQKSTIAIK